MSIGRLALGLVEAVDVVALVALIVIGAGFLTLPVLYWRQRRQAAEPSAGPTLADADLPEVVVQLPIFNEPSVVAGLLDAVAALDWPSDRLHIQLLDDSDDETVQIAEAKLAELRQRGLRVDHVRREHRAGFKAEALAAGLAQSSAPFAAILDADFRPPPHWLRAVMPRLIADPRAGFIQSRCEFVNAGDNWLTLGQGMLLDVHFVMEQCVRARAGLPIQCNGTGAVWRRAAIEAAGGWSADSLSEDLSLALRAALAGWRGLYSSEPAIPGLVPHRVRHWRVQQQRWSMGFAQNARALVARIWAADWPLASRLSAEFLLLYQAVFPVIATCIVAGVIDILCGCPDIAIVGPLWALVAAMVVAVTVGMTLPPFLELGRGGIGRLLAALLAPPSLVVIMAFANARAILTGFLGGGDIFHRTPKGALAEPDKELTPW